MNKNYFSNPCENFRLGFILTPAHTNLNVRHPANRFFFLLRPIPYWKSHGQTRLTSALFLHLGKHSTLLVTDCQWLPPGEKRKRGAWTRTAHRLLWVRPSVTPEKGRTALSLSPGSAQSCPGQDTGEALKKGRTPGAAGTACPQAPLCSLSHHGTHPPTGMWPQPDLSPGPGVPQTAGAVFKEQGPLSPHSHSKEG